MAIGATVEQQLENDNAAEAGAIQYTMMIPWVS